MPIYEYKCASGHQYSESRPMTQPQSLKVCPKCGHDLKPSYSVPSIQLVGKGFYSNGG